MSEQDQRRSIGVGAAAGIGVGAIVGGGILALAGAAFVATGPGAILAFSLNGIVAVLTALSFAEMSTAFPESGGAYAFSRRVLSVRAAFAVGWILWFAYLAAGVLYAMGFAAFFTPPIERLFGINLDGAWPQTVIALIVLALFAVQAVLKESGGGHAMTVGKVVVFAVIIAGAIPLVAKMEVRETIDHFRPFLPSGMTGLLSAMGLSFIALQGFDAIAAVAGEIEEPRRTIPRSMILSIAIALAVYIPLLYVITTVGVPLGESVVDVARVYPETIVAVAVEEYLGVKGWWLVVAAALLSMLSALQANILASSRVAFSMARDHTLPWELAIRHSRHGTPYRAVLVSASIMAAMIFVLPDLAAAGAAASLIFLFSFALVHATAYLARTRNGLPPSAFRVPLFPAVPIIGGIACASLAVFQFHAAPGAALVTSIWLGVGGMFFVARIAHGALPADAHAEALNPEMTVLRGRNPLVLVPIANPDRAPILAEVAAAMVSPHVGRLLFASIVNPSVSDSDRIAALREAQASLSLAYEGGLATGCSAEALMTASEDIWHEISRIARDRRCESILLGFSLATGSGIELNLERCLSNVDSDAVVLNAPAGWSLRFARRILVPVRGQGLQSSLRARILGNLKRGGEREITYLTLISESATSSEAAEARNGTERLAVVETRNTAKVIVERVRNEGEFLAHRTTDADLMLIGLQRTTGRGRAFGRFSLDLLAKAKCPLLLISQRE